ncbi:MAG TPA: flagellar hook-basal body protein [Solirubrobacteraceae bacterium]
MYSAAAGMAAQQQRIDALSNDLANVNTTGYKRVRIAFRDLLYTPTGAGAARGIASGAGAAAAMVGRSTAQGVTQSSDRPFDVALDGPGYLEVTDRNGRRLLTRDGSLQRRADGRLVTSTGAQTGVTLPAGVADDAVAIGADGTVRAANRVVGRLRLVNVPAPEGLQAQGDNLFLPTAASGRPAAAGGTSVRQHVLEGANVDLAGAMTDLIDAQRSYEMASKAITTQDRLMEIANGVKR